MAALTPAQNALKGALEFQPHECQSKGALGKVHVFGHKWIEPRERFAVSGYEAQIGVVHSFAMAVFHSVWSMTVGKFFVEKEPRSLAIQSWKDLGNNLVSLFKCALGVVSPKAADLADKHLFSVRPKSEKEQVEGDVELLGSESDEASSSDSEVGSNHEE